MSAKTETDAQGTDEEVPNLSLSDIIEGENERGIPIAKFVDDLDTFADSFTPTASAELLIGAYSDLHAKYKAYEMTLTQKSKFSIGTWDAALRFQVLHSVHLRSCRTTLEPKGSRAGAVVDISKESSPKEGRRTARNGSVQSCG